MLTPRSQGTEKTRGLHPHADFYISKPWELEDSLARVRVVLRPAKPAFSIVSCRAANVKDTDAQPAMSPPSDPPPVCRTHQRIDAHDFTLRKRVPGTTRRSQPEAEHHPPRREMGFCPIIGLCGIETPLDRSGPCFAFATTCYNERFIRGVPFRSLFLNLQISLSLDIAAASDDRVRAP